jgi:hypothetical protein
MDLVQKMDIKSLSPLTLWVRTLLRWGVLNTTLCDKVCQWLSAGQWFSQGPPVYSNNKTNCNDKTEILLKVFKKMDKNIFFLVWASTCFSLMFHHSKK